MGMALAIVTLGDENIARVLADPPLIWRVVAPDAPELYEDARKAQAGSPSFLGRLFGRTPSAPPSADLTLGEHEGAETDLDKAWHGIHYLLTGTGEGGEQPWAFLMDGGQPAGDIEVGYGPARLFTSEQTRSILDAVELLTVDELRARFHPDDMTAQEIYPEIWSRGEPEENTLGYLLEHFGTLLTFLRRAVETDMGIVVSLT